MVTCDYCKGSGSGGVLGGSSIPCANCNGVGFFGEIPKKVTYQAEGHPPQIDIGNGRTTRGKAYHLIPKIVFETLADRYELGQERKGDKAWNALSEYQDVLENIPFIHERINHIIQHAMEFRQKLIEGKPFVTPNDKGGDAGAILWGGSFLACVAEILDKKRNTEDADS